MSKKELEEVDIRYTEPGDVKYLRDWLSEPGVLRWFPILDQPEIDDAAQRMISFCRYKCSLTAVDKNGIPCGLCVLYLQPYRKLAHQSEFGIIVSPKHRNMGIGGMLIRNIMHLAKKDFRIELLHLQVYADNPAMRLYKRYGFREFGRQSHWVKENGVYAARVFMERFL